MKDIGLKQSDVSKQLNIDKSTISLFLSGEKPLTKIHKSLFYYYFEYYENNIAFLEHLQLMEAEHEAAIKLRSLA
jgi:transcriptional regulator with XRE-family HTH domain